MNKDELRGAEEHVITDREKDNYQRSKDRQPIEKIPKLTAGKLRVFLELVVRSASSTEFNVKLGMNRRQTGLLKAALKIESSDDARRILAQDEHFNEANKETMILQEIQSARQARAEAEVRLKDRERRMAKERKERTKAVRDAIDRDGIKKAERAAQKRLDASEVDKIPATDWDLDAEEAAMLHQDLTTKGWRFVMDKYDDINRADIKAAIKAAGFKVDYDLVRR